MWELIVDDGYHLDYCLSFTELYIIIIIIIIVVVYTKYDFGTEIFQRTHLHFSIDNGHIEKL